MSYVNAPATRLLATSCAVCARPLVDAASVTAAMGPDCRKKHGYNEIPEETRLEANKLIHKVARADSTPTDIADAIGALRELGCETVADRLTSRRCAVTLERSGNELLVKTPYSPCVTEAFRAIGGRRWIKKDKVNSFPVSAGREVLAALRASFPNVLAVGPKGIFAL